MNKVSTVSISIAITEMFVAERSGTKEEFEAAYRKALAMTEQVQKDIDAQRDIAFKLANML